MTNNYNTPDSQGVYSIPHPNPRSRFSCKASRAMQSRIASVFSNAPISEFCMTLEALP